MAKKSTGTARKNALVERKNEGGVGPKLDWTDEWRMATGRYADPLIVQKMHNKQNAFMREVVAEADPIASVLTHAFAENAAAKMIKFYESDQLDSPEIMQDLRAMLKVFKFQEYMKEVILRGQTHGWWFIYPFIDEENQIPMVEIYSEYECEALRIHYDLNNNIQWYDVHFIPRVGFNRQTALRAVNRRFSKEQVMHGTRGTWRYGFGYSIFEGSWDAITKLREESHTNAFKQKIMPFVRVPDSWSKEQIDNFMAALSKIDMMSAMVMKAPLNEMTGEYQELPAVTWATPANNTPTKSSQGSGGSVSDLSSEWSRLTGATRRSVAYFVGGGALSASRAAAGVDSLDDLDADINDFNQYIDEFIIPFVKWFAATIGYALPDSFTVKGWWEWTRDEALYAKVVSEQQKNAAMNQIQDDQQSNADRKNFIPLFESSYDRLYQIYERYSNAIRGSNPKRTSLILSNIERDLKPTSEEYDLIKNAIKKREEVGGWIGRGDFELYLDEQKTQAESQKTQKTESKSENSKTLGKHSKFWGVYGSYKKQGQSDQQAYESTKRELNNTSDLMELIKMYAKQSDTSESDKEIQARLNQYHHQHPELTKEEALMHVVSEISTKRRINYCQESILSQYQTQLKAEYNDYQRMELMANVIAANRNNIIPNTIVPVNSISGNTEYTMLEQDESGNQKLWVKFKAPYNWYSYEKSGEDLSKIADKVYFEGGRGVWKELRGLDSAPRPLPQGTPRYPGATMDKAPLAGRPHDVYGVPYQWEGQGPKGDLFSQIVEQGQQELAAIENPEAPNVEQLPSDLTTQTQTDLPLNPSTQTSAKPAYAAGSFVWGSTGTPQSYEQRPKGMKTKTEALTTAQTPESTISTSPIFTEETTSPTLPMNSTEIASPFSTGLSSLFDLSFNTTEPMKKRKNIGCPIKKTDDYDSKLEYHPLLQEYNSVSGMRKNLHIGYEKAHEMLDQEEKDCERWNLAALATAMHTSNPFIYKIGDSYRIEYICPDSLRQLEGVEVPYGLWHNLDNESSTELPDWQIIGSYKVDQITGEKDLSTIKYIDGWEEKARVVIERLKEMGYLEDPSVRDWALNFIENVKKGIHGDVSTGIVTDVKYNKEKNKWVQTNIKLKSVSAVPIGNCTKPYCSTKNV